MQDEYGSPLVIAVGEFAGGAFVTRLAGTDGVGALQFEVIQHRLRAEYAAEVSFVRLPHQIARWIETEGFVPRDFDDPGHTEVLADGEGRPLVLFESEWHFERAKKTNPKLSFAAAGPTR